MIQLSHLYMGTGKTTALATWTFVSQVMSLLFNMLFHIDYWNMLSYLCYTVGPCLVSVLFWLAYFTEQNIPKVHPCCSICQNLLPFEGWIIILHCVYTSHFAYPFIHQWSLLQLLWIMLLWAWMCKQSSLFKPQIPHCELRGIMILKTKWPL